VTVVRRARGSILLFRAVGLLLLAALWSAVPGVLPASAHAYLLGTTPGDGDRVDTWPSTVEVRLSEAIGAPSGSEAATVVGATAGRVDTGTDVDGNRLVIHLRPDAPQDRYLVSWTAVSTDSHVVSGAIQFGYGVPALATEVPIPATPVWVPVTSVITRTAVTGGLVLALGLVPGRLVLAGAGRRLPRGPARAAAVGVGLVVAGSLVQLGAQLAAQTGSQWRAGLADFLTGGYAAWTAVRLGGIAAAVAGWLLARRGGAVPRRGWALFAAAGALTAVVAVAHAGHGAQSIALLVSTSAHIAGAVAWAGGLVVLAAAVLRRRVDAGALAGLRRWSRYAVVAVGVVVVSGVWPALVGLGFPGALVQTSWGRVLVLKLALVAAALALALAGSRWVAAQNRTPAADGGAVPGRTAALRRRTEAEVGLLAGVVLAAAVLGSTAPGNATYRPTARAEAPVGPYRVEAALTPARTGPATVAVRLEPQGANRIPEEVDAVIRTDDGTIGPLPVEITSSASEPAGPGEVPVVIYHSATVDLPRPGQWRLDVTVRVSEVEQYVGGASLRIEG